MGLFRVVPIFVSILKYNNIYFKSCKIIFPIMQYLATLCFDGDDVTLTEVVVVVMIVW